jgi:glucokinase
MASGEFATLDYDGLPQIIGAFLHERDARPGRIAAACFGVAGPVIDHAASLTNVPWRVDARDISRALGIERVALLNDLQAMAYGVPVLTDAEVLVLQRGDARPEGNVAIIAAGTGLGEALLHTFAGRQIPSPSEGGHADFAARTEREIAVVRALTRQFGRVDVEHVVSGRGLVNLYRVFHRDGCGAAIDLDASDAPAAITSAALDARCAACVETLDVFVEAYGAEAGNLGLRSVATGGVFIGGGIAPKILPAMTAGSFMRAFRAKPPLEAMLRAMPVKIILNDETGLVGAAVFANSI